MTWLVEVLPVSGVESVVLVGAVLVGAVGGLLGPWSVLAGRSLVGDVLSHGMLPGVAAGYLVTGSTSPLVLTFGGASGAGAAAAVAAAIDRAGRTPPDAALGIALAGALSLGLVMLAHVGARGEAATVGLDGYLFGQAATLRTGDLGVIAAIGTLGLVAVVACWRPLKVALLDPTFGRAQGQPSWCSDAIVLSVTLAAVVAGVRTVGVILMVALLVGPTVTARRCTRRLAPLVVVSVAVGATVAGTGALAASRLGAPTGAGITLLVCAVAILATVTPPRSRRPRRAAR